MASADAQVPVDVTVADGGFARTTPSDNPIMLGVRIVEGYEFTKHILNKPRGVLEVFDLDTGRPLGRVYGVVLTDRVDEMVTLTIEAHAKLVPSQPQPGA